MQDQQHTHTDVVHRVDLQLRKWISSALSQQPAAVGSTGASSKKSTKAELAQRLNHTRKVFLVQLKSRIPPAGAPTEDATSDVETVIAAQVESFQRQFSDL